MWQFLARFNKATVATIVAFIAQIAAPLLGWEISWQMQASIVEIIVQAATIALIIGAGVVAGPKNAPAPGTAVVEVNKLTQKSATEVVIKAEAVGKPVVDDSADKAGA